MWPIKFFGGEVHNGRGDGASDVPVAYVVFLGQKDRRETGSLYDNRVP